MLFSIGATEDVASGRAARPSGTVPFRQTLLATACAVLVLAGCGSEPAGSGTASLWITRDRGGEVMLVATVPAGLTAMQALDREADIETRYGGRFVQSIEGVEGNLGRRRDWFYFINGFEGDRSATDYELRDGDVEWWDLRSWRKRMREPVVVGAFPEPFLHGFGGRTRQVSVRYVTGAKSGAAAIGRLLGASSVAPASVEAPSDAHLFLVAAKTGETFTAAPRDGAGEPGSPVRFVFSGDAHALARDPDRYRFRYEVRG
jgi:hypothetical protein